MSLQDQSAREEIHRLKTLERYRPGLERTAHRHLKGYGKQH